MKRSLARLIRLGAFAVPFVLGGAAFAQTGAPAGGSGGKAVDKDTKTVPVPDNSPNQFSNDEQGLIKRDSDKKEMDNRAPDQLHNPQTTTPRSTSAPGSNQPASDGLKGSVNGSGSTGEVGRQNSITPDSTVTDPSKRSDLAKQPGNQLLAPRFDERMNVRGQDDKAIQQRSGRHHRIKHRADADLPMPSTTSDHANVPNTGSPGSIAPNGDTSTPAGAGSDVGK